MATKETRRKAADVVKNLRGTAKAKFETVMREFGNRSLMSGDKQVTSREQAVAIALSEARRARRRR